jgi:hypothetical protein
MGYLFTPQCIVCEGERDRIVLAELAARILHISSISRRLDIVVANGKVVIPRLVQAVEPQFPPDSVIVVADAEGRVDATRRMLERSLGASEPWLVIANPNVESWVVGRQGRLPPDDLRNAARQADLQWIETRHPEFRDFREAVTSIPLSP